MKLEVRVLDAGDAQRACAAYVTQGERAACVAARLEFGAVIVDAERSLSEFEVTLFAPVSEGEAPRVRVRRWHSYEGGTSTLRDVWVEVRATTEGALSVGPSSPAPLALLVPRATARWREGDGGREPTVT